MKVSYKKLFNILKDRGITKTALGNALDLSSTTLAKLSKDEQISQSWGADSIKVVLEYVII